jgi:hypothetical protein
MDDSRLVRRFERVGDLPGDRKRLVDRDRAACHDIGKRLALDQLHDERAHGAWFLHAVDLRDVRMVERREHLRLALEAREPFGIVCEQIRQDFEGDVAIEARIARAIDLPHAPGAEAVRHLTGAEPGARR